MNYYTIISTFVTMCGFVIGLGAVTVIDLHGFLGRKSSYWTEATTRTHKITKPLIWIGITLVIVGMAMTYRGWIFAGIPLIHFIAILIMVANGLFLSFSVSPYLLQREKQGKSAELLPKSWQNKITFGLILSDICWWGSLFLFIVYVII